MVPMSRSRALVLGMITFIIGMCTTVSILLYVHSGIRVVVANVSYRAVSNVGFNGSRGVSISASERMTFAVDDLEGREDLLLRFRDADGIGRACSLGLYIEPRNWGRIAVTIRDFGKIQFSAIIWTDPVSALLDSYPTTEGVFECAKTNS